MTYHRQLPARTQAQRAAIDRLFAERERIEREYQAVLRAWRVGWVQAAFAL